MSCLPGAPCHVSCQVTYKNLETWYEELQENCKGIPTIVVANKIDVDYKVTSKSFNFAAKRKLPFFFVSASDGTNVVKIFQVWKICVWKICGK